VGLKVFDNVCVNAFGDSDYMFGGIIASRCLFLELFRRNFALGALSRGLIACVNIAAN
jgi:hypothetical protein